MHSVANAALFIIKQVISEVQCGDTPQFYLLHPFFITGHQRGIGSNCREESNKDLGT